jgi:hypothetical protein
VKGPGAVWIHRALETAAAPIAPAVLAAVLAAVLPQDVSPPGGVLLERMTRDLRVALDTMIDRVRAGLDLEASPEPGAPLALDLLAADELERIGPWGREVAAALRASARDRASATSPEDRFVFWLDTSEGVPLVVARMIDVLRIDRWVDWREKVPAVSLAVMRPALGERPGPTLWVPTAGGPLCDLLTSPLDVLGNLTAQRFIRWAVSEGARRATLGEPRPGVVVVDGGWSGLANAIGATSRKAAGEVRGVVEALYALDLLWDDGNDRARLISRYRPIRMGAGGARLEITLGDPLLPGFVDQAEGRWARALVPVLPVPPLDALNERLHPAGARLDVLALVELRARVDELREHGAVSLDWHGLADHAGLPGRHVDALTDRWSTGPDRRWDRHPGGWSLADVTANAGARRLLADAGEAVYNGRRGGLRRQARKKAE